MDGMLGVAVNEEIESERRLFKRDGVIKRAKFELLLGA